MIKFTRSGVPVQGLVWDHSNKQYAGYVNSKFMTWNQDGRRSSIRTSKYDLTDRPVFYFNVYKRAGRITVHSKVYTNLSTALQNRPSNYLKTIECSL